MQQSQQRFYSGRHEQQTSDKPTSHRQLLLIRALLHKSIAPLHHVIFSQCGGDFARSLPSLPLTPHPAGEM